MKIGNRTKVKKGQVWRRKHDKLNIVIVGTKGGDIFRCKNLINQKVQHHIHKKTLWLYYELLGSELKYGT